MAALLFVFLILFVSLIIIVCICYELKRTDTQIKVIHVHNGKIISEEEASMYELTYIEVLEGLIIKYYMIKSINERKSKYESNRY